MMHAGINQNLENKGQNRLEKRGIRWKRILGKVTVGLGTPGDMYGRMACRNSNQRRRRGTRSGGWTFPRSFILP